MKCDICSGDIDENHEHVSTSYRTCEHGHETVCDGTTTCPTCSGTDLLAELTDSGRGQYDIIQSNLTSITSSTDEELVTREDPAVEMFGSSPQHPEDRRQSARELQDRLDKQGRDAYAVEYAQTHIKNYE